MNKITSTGKPGSAKVNQQFFRVELDSNADTCCVGDGVMIVNESDRYVTATPFVKSLGTIKKVPIVSAAVAYDDPRSGKVVILIIHQALYFPEMQRCLLCPMQVRLNDVVVNERPKFLTLHPTELDHALVVNDLLICLSLNKLASYFDARTPTRKEYEECDRIQLTYPYPEWCPHDPKYAEEEANRTDDDGCIRSVRNNRNVSQVTHDEQELLKGINGWEAVRDEEIVISGISSDKFKLTSDV